MRKPALVLLALFAFVSVPSIVPTIAVGAPSSQFLRRPDVSGDRLVFTSEGDLWLGSLERGTATRITSDEGMEGPAFFSPDGAVLAFTAEYDGGRDVYVMDVAGGAPRRLTWDPYGVTVLGWSGDGMKVIFRSDRGTTMRTRLWQVPSTGGPAEMLPLPYGELVSVHPDGRIAYVPMSGEWQNWKRYRGGFADDIWLAAPSDAGAVPAFRRLTDDPGVDTEPVWVGDAIYFVSERGGVANLYSLDPTTGGTATAATSYDDFEVRYPQTDGHVVVFEHGDGIGLYDPATRQAREVTLDLHSDRIHARPRRVSALDGLDSYELGPTGKRILVSARGQVLSAPAEHGDVRAVAVDPGARCQYPEWSPDGTQIAYVSDVSGEEEIYIASSSGWDARRVTRDHVGPLGPLVWSPDGKRLLTSDREMRTLLVEVATGAMTTVDQSDRGGSYDLVLSQYRFSPDGKWIALTHLDPTWNWSVHLYEIATGAKTRITSPEMTCYAPAFDPEGKFLYFLADRQIDPRYSQLNHYFSYDRKLTKVSLVTLDPKTASPFLDKNDQEGTGDEDDEKDKDKDKDKDGAKDKKDGLELPKMTVVTDGLALRVAEVPVPADRYHTLEAIDGKLLLEVAVDRDEDEGSGDQLLTFDIEDKELEVLVDKLDGFDLSADRSKLLVRQGKSFTVMDASAREMPKDEGKVETDGWVMEIDPAAEWRQMFAETWRIARDFFYDPGMHGVDWPAVRAKYEPLLAAVAVRDDLTFLQKQMVAELNCGHAYIVGGDQERAPRIPMGYLGVDLEPVAGASVPAYRITRILPGDGFDLDSRSPLLTPGIDASVGDFILAVNGRPVSLEQDFQALLVGLAGQEITLTINDQPSREGAHDVLVQPMSGERRARYYDWVESRRQYVTEHGGDDLGYLHIPDMGNRGFEEFAKHYYSNLGRDGMIYDVRFNGGGYINAMLLLQMSSPQYSFFKPRYGVSWSRQDWAFPGYSTALCNDQSGSNAEEFSDAFQRLKLGPLIGTRTWGGEVGSGGGYRLVDGGRVFIPNYGAWTPDGTWIIEGRGVDPDMVVEDDPTALMNGRDPQLDAAIAYLKKKIAEKPIVRPTPPPFPNKSTGGSDQ
ncbi:MAG: PD40 domain-containing protein [Candidatus Eisenbacteria bacterium]|uniref:Tricorn protease homolog n=1 Tax=Eiseniibacteriota bacterium TaxID=2212470 RepID=A0A956LXL8_UNCEI|nr:PD40 domain-containing protein [Candidatus Eisenbacteria bacterium]